MLKIIHTIGIPAAIDTYIHNAVIVKSFWYFYFDSPHPAKKLPTELEEMKEIDAKNFSLMELALKEVQQAWKKWRQLVKKIGWISQV